MIFFEHKFTTLFQNIRSLNKKRHLLEAATDEDKTIQALCLSETWITTSKLDLLHVDGFKLASCFCRSATEGGGVCILLKEEIDFNELQEISKMSVESIFEACAIEVPNLNLILIQIYWPNSKRMPNIFYNSLTKLLQYIQKKFKKRKVVLGGDFNVNMLDKSTSSTYLLDLMKSYNFKQCVKEATRIAKSSATCLDLVFINFELNRSHISTHEYDFSDHKGVFIQLPIDKGISNKTWYITKRKFSEKNIQNYKQELKLINFHDFINENQNVNENYDSFQNILITILNKCIPKQKIKIKYKPKKSWLTTGLKISCKNKRLLKILVTTTENQTLLNNYKLYEKILKRTVKTSKRLNNIKRIKKSDNIIKTTWLIIKEQTNNLKHKNKINIKLNIQNNILEDPKSVANSFNNFFLSVANDYTNSTPPGRSVMEPTENSMYLSPVTPQEVYKLIKRLKNKRSFGHDELPPLLIRSCSYELTPIVTFLINQSFTEATVPDLLKISIIRPIYKKGDATDCTNYRPIALLPTFAKILETAMANRLYSYCEKYNIFSSSQHGFRKNCSTSLAVFKYISEILNIINNKKYAIGILLDMSKAYDRVLYDILLNKLYGVGVRGVAYQWFVSYLKNRVQCVEIEHHDHSSGDITKVRSKIGNVNKSIPQGSVLGGLLFLLYINDLPKIIENSCSLFADDISIVIPCENSSNLNTYLDTVLNTLVNWLNEHNLQLNFTKTKLLQFKPYQKQSLDIQYSFENKKLECVKSYPLLGINIDSNIDWKDHIAKICTKLSRFTYALYQLKKNTDVKTALTAYYAYAHSWLIYGIVLWGNCVNTVNLFRLQKRCLRTIVNISPMTSCKPYFKQQKMLTLPSLYIFEVSIFVKKNPNLFTLKSRPPNLRPHSRLAIPSTTLKIVLSGPLAMSAKIYNNIPENIQRENNINKFKLILKSYLIEKCFYTLQEFFDEK